MGNNKKPTKGAFGKSRRPEPAVDVEEGGVKEGLPEVMVDVGLDESNQTVVDARVREEDSEVLENLNLIVFPLIEVRGWQWRMCVMCDEDTRQEIYHPYDLTGGVVITCPDCGTRTTTVHPVLKCQLVLTELRGAKEEPIGE